jgi:zinc metalloprotease ZmpB
VKVVDRTGLNVAAPSQPVGTDFVFDVRTNEFAAVNAYYHANRFFETVESLGFPVATYFPSTTFPVAVDHRGLGDVINAHFVGDGLKGIDHLCFALNDLTDIVHPVGRACDSRSHWHELGGHATLYEHIDSVNFNFAHSAGDALSAIFHAPDSNAPDLHKYAPWHPTNLRRFDRDPALGWAWGGIYDLGMEESNEGYNAEEILATTLFRIYQSIGGDSTDPSRKQFASRMMIYLVLRAIYELTPSTSPRTAVGFASKLAAVDLLEWTSEGVFGGAYNKVIRWSFEKQGLYQAPGTRRPITGPGRPPAVDVYIDDGRGGEYAFQEVHSQTTAIWNRLNSDGQTNHQRPVLGTPNFAYVKVKNRGFEDAGNVQVRAFHRKPGAGLQWPTDLQPMTTPSIAVGSLRANNAEEKTVGPFEWTPVNGADNRDSMLLIVSATKDPSNVDNFAAGEVVPDWRLVPNDNNIGMRTVVPV